MPREDNAPTPSSRVSVVVPTRNRASYLPALLTALDAQTHRPLDVIVVDDASSDGTVELLARWAGEGRRVERLEQPAGSYAARNRGWRAASGELIAFTDDDCLPEPNWLAALIDSVSSTEFVAAQGVTLARPGRITPFTHQIEQRRPGPPYRTCNMVYRRSVLERLNGFEPIRWYADNILGLRAAALGSIAFAPDAVVNHHPRPREWRARPDWRKRFEADALHRRELRRLGAESVGVAGRALPIVLWILRPLVKQSWAHARYAGRHPLLYLRQMRPMIREKREMLGALREFWSETRRGGSRGNETFPTLPECPLVSVIIVTRDRDSLLNQALESIERQTWSNREVVVVDHAGQDSTHALAARYGVHYQVAAGGTLAAARQMGVDAAHGELVAFLDDDCIAESGWLQALVAGLNSSPGFAGMQGRTRAGSGPIGSHAVRIGRPDPLYQTCNIAYRHSALRRAGGFDLRFTGWFEDTALAARVVAHGPIGFQPDAVVLHQAVPRVRRTRAIWRAILRDERRLAREYRAFYRRTRGPGFVPTVVARWLFGSTLKTLLRELRAAPADLPGYARLTWLLARERVALIAALFDVLLRPRDPRP